MTCREFHTRVSKARLAFFLAVFGTLCALSVGPPRHTAAADGPSSARFSKSAAELTRLAEQMRRKWNLDGAEAVFRQAASIDPQSIEAAIGLARIARARFDYKGAISLLEKSAGHHPNSAAVLAEFGLVYLAAEEPRRAMNYFQRALALDPSNAQAKLGRAGVDLTERDYQAAESRLRESIALGPQDNQARVMLARVLLEENRNTEAALEAERALAIEPNDAEALSLLAFVRSTERKPDEVRALARRAVELDPLNTGARRLLSQYIDGRRGYAQKISEAARSRCERGLNLKREGKLDEAVSEFEAALSREPRYYRALIALGDVWMREGDYERAATAARLAKEVDGEGAVAHLILSYANRGLQERARIEIGAVDFAALYYKKNSPPRYELTREIFPNYDALTARQQLVVDTAVAPLASYLPKLARNRARHYLLSFDERVNDLADFDDVDKEQTFDGRYYASLRGVGGRVTVSGIEYIDIAARGGFHTIAHEFAHQVHIAALSREATRSIRKLYEQALRERRTLDYYAAANEYEYFAQGYEAFVSEQKRPTAGVTARHTRAELLARDPALYNFLVTLVARSRRR
jgi:Tfp pilus assembly protein PilF